MFGRIADSRTISIWLIAYYAGTRNNSVIDATAVQKNSQDLVQYWMRMQQTVAAAAPSFAEFPPMQHAASFNLEEVKKKVEEIMKHHEGQ